MASSSSRAHNLRAPSTGAAIAWTEAWAAQPARLRPVTAKWLGGGGCVLLSGARYGVDANEKPMNQGHSGASCMLIAFGNLTKFGTIGFHRGRSMRA